MTMGVTMGVTTLSLLFSGVGPLPITLSRITFSNLSKILSQGACTNVHVCTYVCMYVRTYVFMYVCMYVWLYVYMYVYLNVTFNCAY